MKIEAQSTLLFIGDSITDAGRDRDADGEGIFNEAYGDGYVRIIKSLLEATLPAHPIRIRNLGVSGNTILDLEARWHNDVMDRQRNWLSVMIGINDVWRQFDQPLAVDTHVSLERYAETYRRLLAQVRPNLDGLVIATPYVIDNQRNDPMRKRMDQYGVVAEQMAEEFDATFENVQAAFDSHLEHYHPKQLAWDRIHPNATGHMIIARAWLDALGYQWASS